MSDEKFAVLVADDEESMRFFLEKTLRRAGFDVTTVADGVAALEALDRQPWSVLLVDLKMPRLDGVGVLEAVRARGVDVPVVLMTGYGSVNNALDAMKRGATDYVTKPFHAEQIVQTIQAAIERGGRPRSMLVDEEPAGTEPIPPWAGGAIGQLFDEARGRGAHVPPPNRPPTLREAVRVLEWIYADESLRRFGGNVTAAARDAGISRPSFHRKMRELEIDAETYRR